MNPPPTWTLTQADHLEMAQRWRHHHAAWGGGMALDLYLRREESLNAGELCRQALRMWLLKDASGAVLASCETYAARLWYGQAEGDLCGLKLETIASVLVEPRLRQQGFASALLSALAARLRQEEVAAAALYSDVGPGLYRRAGFLLHPARQSEREPDAETWPDDAEELVLAHVADLLQTETELAPTRLASTSAPAVVEVASAARIAWFHARSQYRAWARGQQHSELIGARGPDGGYVLWASESPEPALHALLWRPRTANDAAVLATAALAHTRELGLRRAIWWDADRDTGLDTFRQPHLQPPGCTHRTRTSSLPMLAWLDATRPMPLVWSAIERAGWS